MKSCDSNPAAAWGRRWMPRGCWGRVGIAWPSRRPRCSAVAVMHPDARCRLQPGASTYAVPAAVQSGYLRRNPVVSPEHVDPHASKAPTGRSPNTTTLRARSCQFVRTLPNSVARVRQRVGRAQTWAQAMAVFRRDEDCRAITRQNVRDCSYQRPVRYGPYLSLHHCKE